MISRSLPQSASGYRNRSLSFRNPISNRNSPVKDVFERGKTSFQGNPLLEALVLVAATIQDVQRTILTPPHFIERLPQQLSPVKTPLKGIIDVFEGCFDIPVQFLLADDLVVTRALVRP